MKSNGFGSLEQSIIIHVPEIQTKHFEEKLGIKPFKKEGCPLRTYFTWKRWTTRSGNDQDVVYDLFGILGSDPDKLDWKIDWEASKY